MHAFQEKKIIYRFFQKSKGEKIVDYLLVYIDKPWYNSCVACLFVRDSPVKKANYILLKLSPL